MASEGKEMAKGASASKNKKGQLSSSQTKEKEDVEGHVDRVQGEKELFLRSEFKALTENLDMLIQRLKNLHLENDFLDKEATRLQQENKEYRNYLDKKAWRNKDLIITLSDHNKELLEEVQMEAGPLLLEYSEKEKELQDILFQKEMEYSRVLNELDELKTFTQLRAENTAQIKHLETQARRTNIQYSDIVEELKRTSQQEIESFEKEATRKVQILSKKAIKEAQCALIDLTSEAQEDSKQLRQQVLLLIRRLNILKAHRLWLQAQNKKLLEEVQYSKDLAQARHHQSRYPDELEDQSVPKVFEHGKDLVALRKLLKHATFPPTAWEVLQQHHLYESLNPFTNKPEGKVHGALISSTPDK